MSSITLSAGVRQSLSALQSAASQQSVIQNRLATGKKVNSALDNPASFFTASGLSNRAGDLGSLLDDMGQAIKTLEAANKAITAISKLVDNAKSIAKQAQAAPADVAATPAAAAKLTGTVDLATLSDTDGGNFSMTVGGTTKTVTFTGSVGTPATIDTVIAAIEAQFAGVATKSADGKNIVLTATNTNDSITVASSADATALGLVGTAAPTAAIDATTKRADLAKDLAGIMAQIDELASDASYNGVNLLQSTTTLKVAFNETGKSKLEITGKDLNSQGLKLDTLKLGTNSEIESALAGLKSATDTLRSQAATFGANLSVVQNRQEFTKGMIDTLTSGADLLVVADPNEEGANLLALNTRSQIAQTTLAMASQADSAVLRLF